MPHPRFIIRIRSLNLRVELWINDIPVTYMPPEEGRSPLVLPVNQFLVQGRNTIAAVLHAGPRPSLAGKPWPTDPLATKYSGSASLDLTGAWEVVGSETPPPPLTPPLAIRWQGMASPRPERMEREFNLSQQMGPWAWESAVRHPALDATVQTGVQNYLIRLHGLLATRQFERFMAESSVKLQELTERAYGVPVDYLRPTMLRELRSHAAEPYQLAPLEPAELDLRLVAGGQLVECLCQNRRHALEYRQAAGNDTFFLPAMVGQVGSHWQILR